MGTRGANFVKGPTQVQFVTIRQDVRWERVGPNFVKGPMQGQSLTLRGAMSDIRAL